MVHEYSGARNPTLVMLPGLDGCQTIFEPLRACLPQTLTTKVLCYPQDVPLTYDELTQFTRDSLPADEPYLLLGHSFAGPLAIRLAAEKHGNLMGLILAVGFARSPHPWIPKVSRHLIGPLVHTAFPILRWANRVFHWEKSIGIQNAIGVVVETMPPQVFADRVRQTLVIDYREELKKLAVPVLSLSGRFDLLVPPWNSRAMEKIVERHAPQCPEFVRRVFPMGHMVLRGRPEESAAAIVEMLVACTTGQSVEAVVQSGEPADD